MRDILLPTILGAISGADSWTDIGLFGKSRQNDLTGILQLPNGIPPHDTLGRGFGLLDPKQLEAGCLSWVNPPAIASDGEWVAIDGKTLRRPHGQPSGANAIHMVSAWASKNGLVPGQTKTGGKSNETSATPRLLAKLNGWGRGILAGQACAQWVGLNRNAAWVTGHP